jgi:hypothetical protein
MYKKFQEQTQKPVQEFDNLITKISSIVAGGGDINDIDNLIKTENIVLNNKNQNGKSILHEIVELNDNIIELSNKLKLIVYCLDNNVYIDHINIKLYIIQCLIKDILNNGFVNNYYIEVFYKNDEFYVLDINILYEIIYAKNSKKNHNTKYKLKSIS